MTSLPVKQASSVDLPKPALSVLSSVPIGGAETRCWRDSMISTSHADISVRQTTGKKLPILLLHGGGLCKEAFDRQLESSLGAQHRMIAIDLPGHGASSDAFDPDRTYRVEGLADVALEVLETLGIDNAVVVGASLGGWVGLQMLQTFPGLVGLTLTGTLPGDRAGPLSAPEFFEVGRSGEDEPNDDEVDAFLRRSLGVLSGAPFARAVKRTDARATKGIGDDIRSKAGALWPVAAGASATPIMVVNGARGVPAELGEVAAAAARPAITHYAIPHAGPAPFVDAPVIYNHLLERFMQRMARRERHLMASPTLWYGG
jgi:pimeloyl-ACP methyl ester carboxylesterase